MYEAYPSVPWYADLWRDWLGLFRGDWFDIALGIFFALLAVLTVLAIGYGIFRAADRWFTPHEEGAGRVTRHWIIEGYWRSTTKTEWKYHYSFTNGKYEYGPVSVPGPDEWVPPQPMVEVTLIDGNTSEEFAVNDSEYSGLKEQTPVRITFQRGRFSGDVYIGSYARA